MIKGLRTFPKGTSPKGDVMTRLGFELAYYVAAVQHINSTSDHKLLLFRRYSSIFFIFLAFIKISVNERCMVFKNIFDLFYH